MIIRKTFISILLLSFVGLQAKNQTIEYKVKSGDSLILIAKKYHTTVEDISKNNQLNSNHLIRVGQILKINADSTLDKNSTKPKQALKKEKNLASYTVAGGDTLYTVAHSYHCTINDLLKANNIKYDAKLKVGQVLKIPTDIQKQGKLVKKKKEIVKTDKKKPQSEKIDYTVKRGDTLYIIAHAHHTTIKEVLELNGMKAGDLIRVGQSLKLQTNTYFPDKSANEQKKTEVASNSDAKTEEQKAKKGIYKVKSGDTLFSIARKNHITLKEIMALNNLKLNDVIKVGQELTIVSKKSFVDSKSLKKTSKANKDVKLALDTKKYKVRRKDTIKKIAKRFGMSVALLRKLNHLNKKSKLKKGMMLSVIDKTKIKKYKVKKGDTLWLIAKKNNISLKKLRALNHFSKKDRIHTGMLLSVGGEVQKEQSKRANTYKVKKGDTWAKIARINNISIKKLKKLNHLGKRAKLKKGMVLALNKQVKTDKAKKSIRSKRARNALFTFASRSGRGDYGIIRTAKRYLGRRYVWGAEGPRTFDCSGFTQYVLRKSKGVRLPRVSRKQAYYGKYVSRRNLRAGDLIFFDTSRRRRGYVNHVGIYIGNNKFIHASSARHRVVITSLNKPFYSARFKWGRRVY